MQLCVCACGCRQKRKSPAEQCLHKRTVRQRQEFDQTFRELFPIDSSDLIERTYMYVLLPQKSEKLSLFVSTDYRLAGRKEFVRNT